MSLTEQPGQPNQQQIIRRLQEQVQKIDLDIGHYTQKHEVQTKRLKYLKKQNEELKQKKVTTFQNSQQIKQQNASIKQQSKQLKEQLKQLQAELSLYSGPRQPKQLIIKQLTITAQTQQIDLSKSGITDSDVQAIKGFGNIKTLVLGQNQVTDQGMRLISSGMGQLRKLFLNHNQITDQGLKGIDGLKSLKCLDLRSNKITDQGIVQIGKLCTLTQLSLSNNNLSDSSMPHLVKLSELQYLDITSNKISPEGGFMLTKLTKLTNLYLSHNKLNSSCVLKYLQELKELRVLDVRFNQVTTQEKEKLKQEKQNRKEWEAVQVFL